MLLLCSFTQNLKYRKLDNFLRGGVLRLLVTGGIPSLICAAQSYNLSSLRNADVFYQN